MMEAASESLVRFGFSIHDSWLIIHPTVLVCTESALLYPCNNPSGLACVFSVASLLHKLSATFSKLHTSHCAGKNWKLSTWQVHSLLCATFTKPVLKHVKTMKPLNQYHSFGEDSAQAIHAHPRKTCMCLIFVVILVANLWCSCRSKAPNETMLLLPAAKP